MSQDFGHIKVSRKAFLPQEAGGDVFWNERRTFSRWEAWEYMIQAAAFSDHKRMVAGAPVVVPRGHTPPLSLSYLADAWQWSVKRVRTFLDQLVEMDRIRAVGGARSGTTYLIMNYDYYQSSSDVKSKRGARSGHAKGHSEETLGGTANANDDAGSGDAGARSGAQQGAGRGAGKGQQVEALEEGKTDMSSSAKPNPDPVREVFDYWQRSTGYARATLTDDRRAKIKARLRRYSVTDLQRAVDGVMASPFHQGDNDRQKRYDDILTIFKTDGAAERLMHSSNGNGGGGTVVVDD